MQRAFRLLNLERGLIIGVVLLVAGIVMAIYGFLHWGSVDFGSLDARDAVRMAIPAATLSVLGVQTIMASFFLSVLGLSRR
jgi:amino acid transporter